MAKFAVHVRLRPIRFGFLVKPHDVRSLLEIFRVNTCLWGGSFNPIIPHLRSVPRWWDRHGHTFESARQIMNGYLALGIIPGRPSPIKPRAVPPVECLEANKWRMEPSRAH